jgi:hypothetical protein
MVFLVSWVQAWSAVCLLVGLYLSRRHGQSKNKGLGFLEAKSICLGDMWFFTASDLETLCPHTDCVCGMGKVLQDAVLAAAAVQGYVSHVLLHNNIKGTLEISQACRQQI